jgi:Family of unknown function (DUF5681)
MIDAPGTPTPKHTGGKFRKGVSGNPGGKKRVIPTPQAPQPAPQVGANPQPQPEVEQPSNAGRKKDGTFAKGFVANPAGKPKGTRHHATRLAEALIDGKAKELVDKAVDMALAGDPTAMRIVMDRLCPPRRERPVTLDMPRIKSAADLIKAAAALTNATAAGDITPGEAASLSTLVGNVAKAIEMVEIVASLTKLEERLAAKGN